jgi:poly(A) polymerase
MRPGRLRSFVLDGRFEALAAMVRADCLASHGDTSDVDCAIEGRRRLLAESPSPRPLLRGRDLIRMGFAPGPQFGRVLKEIDRLARMGELTTPAAAKLFAKNFLPKSASHRG